MKRELAYRLVMGGQTDSQVAKSSKFHAYTVVLRSTCVDFPALGGQTVKNLRMNLSSTKVNASGWPNETQVENLCRLVSPFGQRFKQYKLVTKSVYNITPKAVLRSVIRT